MVNALACVALAVAAVCAPGPVAGARFAVLWPAHGAGRRSWKRGRAGPAVLVALAGLAVAGPAGALAGMVAAEVVRRRRAQRRAAAAAATTAGELADAVRRIAEELRAGSHPAAALAGVSADGPRAQLLLTPAAMAARLGDGVPAALRRAGAQQPGVAGDLERLAAGWLLAERHGIPLAELLAGTHGDLRWRLQFADRVHAQLAGPRATASVLTALPAVGLVLGQLLGADPVAVLRDGVLGQVLLVLGVGLIAAGIAWTEHILRAAVPR